jgi:hypothetical protein
MKNIESNNSISSVDITTMVQICELLNGKGYRAEVGEWPTEKFEPCLIMEGWVAEISFDFPKACNVITLDGESYLFPNHPIILKEAFQLDYAAVIKNMAEWAASLPAKLILCFEVDVPSGEDPDDFAAEMSDLINIDDCEVDNDEEDDDYPAALNYSLNVIPQDVKKAIRRMRALEYAGDIKFSYLIYAYPNS